MVGQYRSRGHKFRYGKIIVAFLLGCITIVFSLAVNKTTFRQILNRVQQLSTPNTKLALVNNIFRQVVQLDQMQRLQTLQSNTKPYNPFIKESQRLQHMLDTLGSMSQGNDVQMKHINEMKSILHERDKLFIDYLTLQASLNKNDTLITQLKNLSSLIAGNAKSTDSNLVTTEKKVTTTTIEHEDTTADDADKKNFWDKLFGRKKVKNKQFEKLVKEELNVKLDTSALGKQDSIIQMLGQTVTVEQSSRVKRRSMLSEQQLHLTNESNMLITQLLSILKDIEAQEMQRAANNNLLATQIADTDIKRMNAILISFVVATVVLMYLIFIDILRSNRYRRQLVLAKEEAEQLGQVKQRFLANMSHEIRTPLQTIIGIAEQMQIKGKAEKKELDMFYHSSQYLLQIANEILDYSRITSGKFHFELKAFNMYHLINDIEHSVHIQAAQKGLQLVFKGDLSPTQNYIGDPFRLKQILYNLLANAVKYTNKGVIMLTTTCRDHEDRTDFTFCVKDTGVGMSENEVEKIFLEFETLNNPATQKSNGAGLGLAIVRALVEGQNGSISVNSEINRGSEFKVNLSFARTTEIERSIEQQIDRAQVAHAGKVWVVDDDKFILHLCRSILEKYHIAYRCFESAEELLAVPIDPDVNLMLLDIRLPGIDGVELCKQLKKKAPATTRIVALTAQVLPDEKEAILNEGFDGLLTKPFMEQDLLGTIMENTVIDKKQLATAHSLIDLSVIEEMSDHDKELINKTLSRFVVETNADLNRLKAAMANTDGPQAAECLHRLASRCGQVGAKNLLLQIRRIETILRDGASLTETSDEIALIYDEVSLITETIRFRIREVL